MRKPVRAVVGILSVLICLQVSSGRQVGTPAAAPFATRPSPGPRLNPDFGRLPLQFIPNEGQVRGPAAFSVQGKARTVYFAAEGLTFVLGGAGEAGPGRPDAARWVVKLDFVDANPKAAPVSLERSGTIVSYFLGEPGDWRSGIAASSRIIYRDLWPGIDLICSGTMDRMKHEFIVHPGADPSQIRLAYRGAESVELTPAGRLVVSTPVDVFEDDVPSAWQDVDGVRTGVAASYALRDLGQADVSPARIYGFELGDYDEDLTLVLDPAVLVYCGYIGGVGWDEGKAIAVDGSGNAYVTGYANFAAGSFPVTVGPDLTYNGDPSDAFVAKISADGASLVYCGYIGGGGWDEGIGIAVDGGGSAYIVGDTSSGDLPVTSGSALTYGGDRDAFVAKVNAGGTALVYCGYIGGSYGENGRGIAVDGSGHAYVTGETFSENLPTVVGPDLTFNGSQDAYVAKVNAGGTAFDYCGYIGSWSNQEGRGIAVDADGNAYVTGNSASDFPVKVGPGLEWSGGYDAFVAKVRADGTDLVYGGYIGGSLEDVGLGIAVDASGSAYVTGYADSDEESFPVKVGPDLTWNGGSSDAFVAKVKADGASLEYCGFIGGAAGGDLVFGNDRGNGIAVDGAGNAYVIGQSDSREDTFPVSGGPDLTWNSWNDAFVAKVNPFGTGLVYCGYVGGSNEDVGLRIAVDGSGNAYLSGYASSSEATFPANVGPDLTWNEGWDAFVAKVSAHDIPAPDLGSLIPPSSFVGEAALSLTVTGGPFEDGSVVLWNGAARPTTFLGPDELSAAIGAADLAGARIVAVAVRNPNGGVSNALEFAIVNPVPSVTSLAPAQAMVGGGSLTLTVRGSQFITAASVRWQGSARATTFVSSTELQAAIPAADLATAGRSDVTVVNPPPGGGTSNAVAFPVATFAMDVSPASVTVTAGQSAAYTVRAEPLFGSFDAAVTFECGQLPKDCTASWSTATVTPGAAAASATLTLSTRARTEAQAGGPASRAPLAEPGLGLFALLPAICLGLCFRRISSARIGKGRLAAAILICALVLIAGCGTSGGDDDPHQGTGTPAGTYHISVRASSGNITDSTTITLIVR